MLQLAHETNSEFLSATLVLPLTHGESIDIHGTSSYLGRLHKV